MHKILILCLICISSFTSCSVAMAARKDGVSLERLQCCRTRGQLISCGAHLFSSERSEDGSLVEVYQIQKERGSAARALMHGALDVSTFGLWEVVGTPIEATLDQKDYYTIRVTFDSNEVIQKVELL